MRPGRARAARGRVTGGRPNQSALGWTPARGRESRARSPTSPVSPARGPRLAAGGEPAPRQKRISRASRAGTGFARRVRRACVPPRGLRTGHVARHGCRVGLRKAATGGRARRSVCLDGVVERFFAFSWKRRNSEDVPGSLSGGLLLLHVFATGHHTQSVLNRVSEIRKKRQAASANRRFSPVKTAGARRRGQISRRRRAAGRSRPHTDPTSTPPP